MKEEKKDKEKGKAAGPEGKKAAPGAEPDSDDGTYIVGGDDKPAGLDRAKADPAGESERQRTNHSDEQTATRFDGKRYAHPDTRQGGAPGAYAPKGTAAPAGWRPVCSPRTASR